MKNSSQLFNRRFMLKGAGACISLPLLESLSAESALSMGKSLEERTTSSTTQGSGNPGNPLSKNGIPKRLVYIAMGYGADMKWWSPKGKGANYQMNHLTKPFEKLKDDISFVQGLSTIRGKNPHSTTTNFLTGNDNLSQGSCDQLAAAVIGKETRHDYITMGKITRANGHGNLPSYGTNGKPVGAYRDIRAAYNALFSAKGISKKETFNRLSLEKSVLDAVKDDAKKLFVQISKEDTRVLSYALPTENVAKIHPHRMSHQNKRPWVQGKPSPHQARDLAFSNAVAKFLTKLKTTKEADGSTLLDHCLVNYGSTNRGGHGFGQPPLMVAGQGGGGLKQGQVYNMKGRSLACLWLSELRHVGVKIDKFNNSKGPIKEIGFS